MIRRDLVEAHAEAFREIQMRVIAAGIIGIPGSPKSRVFSDGL